MITLDTLRAAALSDQPWIELDKLVRAELAAGRLTRAIYDEIMSLQERVSDTPGYTEDAHDAIGDTLDALVGFCRADCAYKNPPVLPSEEEIAKLPRRAQVAFAARCARRVLVLVQYVRSSDRIKTLEIVAVIVANSEKATSVAELSNPRTREEVQSLLHAYWENDPQDKAVAEAISSALCAGIDAENQDRLSRASAAAKHAAAAGLLVANITPHIRRDFDHLSRLAEWQEWTDDTPVPPEVFGPLWPAGPPKGWPPITDVPQRTDLALEAFAREQATEQVIEDDIVNLFNALNRYYIARSGVRLTLEQFRSLLPAFVPAEV